MNVRPALICNLPNPKVLWYQTDVSVILRIILTDVDDYFLLVDEDHLRFSTTIKDRPYYLCLYLFGAVIPEKCTHRNFQREIRVILPKAHRWIHWLRLCLEKVNNPHIITDPNKVGEQKIVVKNVAQRDWNQYRRENNITNIGPPPSSSDDSESDDEMMDALIDHLDVF